MLVPLMIASAVSEVMPTLRMLVPGPKRLTQLPMLEKEERALVMVVAPTATASGEEAGDWLQASPP